MLSALEERGGGATFMILSGLKVFFNNMREDGILKSTLSKLRERKSDYPRHAARTKNPTSEKERKKKRKRMSLSSFPARGEESWKSQKFSEGKGKHAPL